MKKYILLGFASLLAFTSSAQGVEDFESVTLDSGNVLNGKAGETQYKLLGGSLTFPVYYDTSWGGFWSSGWAISRKIDSATVKSSSTRHLYCAKTGKGYANSNTFIVGQNGSGFTSSQNPGLRISGFYITNSTYAYNSMKLGDLFGKKFGGKNGKDSDYLFVRIKFWNDHNLNDSQDIYLADFRFADSTKDYILKDWVKVSSRKLKTDSVSFEVMGSDTSSNGLNTPSFFVLDNVSLDYLENVKQPRNQDLKLYPNPAQTYFTLETQSKIRNYKIYSITGALVLAAGPNQISEMVDVSHLNIGNYIFVGETSDGMVQSRFEIIR